MRTARKSLLVMGYLHQLMVPAGSLELQKYRYRGRRGPPAPSTLAGVDVTFEVSGDLLTLPEGQATILAEKLRLFAAGQFRDDVRKLEELGTSRAWLAGTRQAADLIEMALVDERSGPVPFGEGRRGRSGLPGVAPQLCGCLCAGRSCRPGRGAPSAL